MRRVKWKSNPPSAINLKGRWLEECSFITGIPVTVTVARQDYY
ncbi:SymE family type I addiction module toxin [Pectobacterium aroidearum]